MNKKTKKYIKYFIMYTLVFLLAIGGGYIGNVFANSIDAKESGDSLKLEQTKSTSKATGDLSKVSEKCMESVVEIKTEQMSRNRFYGNLVSEGAGSGVIISENGYIVTNYHVIENAQKATVTLANGKEYEAEYIGGDKERDIAVLKIDANGLVVATLGDSDKLAVGEDVFAIGNPLGELGGTVTEGIISSTSREVSVEGNTMDLLQTSAAINPGNSGGGLFNMNGELIGIVNAKSSGSDIEGLGFAIPVNTAIKIVEQLVDDSK